MNKMIIFFCLFAVLFFTANIAWSHDYHYHEQTVISQSVEKVESNGIATGIAAAQCHHNISMKRLQGCAGYSEFKGMRAYTFGLAKKFNKTLINGSITTENGDFGIGLGANWAF